MMLLLLGIIIKISVFATGSIAIEGHVLTVDYQSDNYLIQKLIVKNSNGNNVLYESYGCYSNICTYDVGPGLPTWVQVWVYTDHGVFQFNRIAS